MSLGGDLPDLRLGFRGGGQLRREGSPRSARPSGGLKGKQAFEKRHIVNIVITVMITTIGIELEIKANKNTKIDLKNVLIMFC